MAPQYATWAKSAHREVATCNDCHVPQDNIFRHYFFKTSDGLYHSTSFSLRLEPQAIRIRETAMRVVQENCVRCPYYINHDDELQNVIGSDLTQRGGPSCVGRNGA